MVPPFFLISSFDEMPKHSLYGHCFQDEDLIIGDVGYDQYRITRKAEIRPGQDGSYIVVNSSDRETTIGTDHSGYYKLFLYRHREDWALSNSLIELARFAAGKNLPVTIDESHLSTFFITGPFGNQLTSLRTSVKEIRLVPSTREVVIPKSPGPGVTLRPTARTEEQGRSYSDGIREYLRVWTGRMAALLQSDMIVESELTGGQDSRAVLGLLLAGAQRAGRDLIQKVNFVTHPGAQADHAVARQIAEHFGLRFMDRDPSRRKHVRTELSEAYQKWKSLCLGVYAPIYFPGQRPVPNAVALGGAGGEGHRNFYKGRGIEDYLDRRRHSVPSSKHFNKLKQDIIEDLAFLRQGSEALVDPMIVHYRHFRDRCHGGRTPQYKNLITPLSSAILRQASSLSSPEQLDRRQVAADILINANRDLAFMPYDMSDKSFGADHLATLVDAREAIDAASTGGRTFAEEAKPEQAGDFTREKGIQKLREDFLTHYENVEKTGFFPNKYLERARRTVEEAASNGSFVHAVEACAVSHVILAGELSSLSHKELQGSSSWQTWKNALVGRIR
ncbi:hypothetical protein [Microvirga lotononidis]|uniref:Asparagine synthase (Glutamine-hydrolyzing) n=1 Tax=Microvirga lotononidis TaxID=864069 RepID=I4YYX0_9HYPH|nr:hypothetical protein [Microvirga lotononidis]EIM29162.1 hypothetical protein MicloDRAFT_00016340 [Microvirga lotononidis]WQO29002.1 hypothetical protein U0023_08025 [Microvirga lotononidis]